ncbi:MAG: ATP-binding protein [Desulfobacteraceae bacterium]|nr:MAG: ATP-binding protein [Desulfobacteraceae bacterium]
MQDHILRVVQADNPWLLKPDLLKEWVSRHLPAEFIPRGTVLQPDERVCLVIGPRQAGKSTLIWKFLSATQRPFLFLNCEETAVREWLASPAVFLQDFHNLVDPAVPLFFEEIQRIPEAGLFLKGLVDRKPGMWLFATGSSSFDLEAETRESLAGRASRHLLLPFSLSEISKRGSEKSPILQEQYIGNEMERMLCYGGYPTVLLSKQPEKELSDLVEAFIIRDASDRFQIRLPAAFRKILEFAASQIGNLCNYSEWASLAGISNDTVSEYVQILQDSHIIRLIRPFVGGKRAELTSMPKVYFIDTGIRNLIFGGFQPVIKRPDQGALWENFVFEEIIKNIHPMLDSVRFWRSKAGAEVDFVVEHQGRLAACEVKAGDARGKISRSVRNFIEAYTPELFFMVGNKNYSNQQIENTEIRFIRFIELGGLLRDWVRK